MGRAICVPLATGRIEAIRGIGVSLGCVPQGYLRTQLAPEKKCGKLDSFDAASNTKAQIEVIEASLDRPRSYPQLPGDVGIFASFQQKVDDLLFAASESHDSCRPAASAFQVRKFF